MLAAPPPRCPPPEYCPQGHSRRDCPAPRLTPSVGRPLDQIGRHVSRSMRRRIRPNRRRVKWLWARFSKTTNSRGFARPGGAPRSRHGPSNGHREPGRQGLPSPHEQRCWRRVDPFAHAQRGSPGDAKGNEHEWERWPTTTVAGSRARALISLCDGGRPWSGAPPANENSRMKHKDSATSAAVVSARNRRERCATQWQHKSRDASEHSLVFSNSSGARSSPIHRSVTARSSSDCSHSWSLPGRTQVHRHEALALRFQSLSSVTFEGCLHSVV